MNNRDNFPLNVKRAVALRAGYRCSFRGCSQATVGPSDESPDAVTMIGEAAHIHAASPGSGARRYLASMAPEERSDIDNAIWLCANHARVIDRDESTYTADALRDMKLEHETRCAAEVRNIQAKAPSTSDLVALGPDVIGVGDMIGGTESDWHVLLRHFVDGDFHTLVSFIERFRQTDNYDRYVCVGALGDGRVLRAAPSWTRHDAGYIVTCPIFPAFPRIEVSRLGTSLALSDSGDILIENGDWATLSGIESLPQKVRTILSMQRGESQFYKKFGSRLADYYVLLRNSPWYGQLIKLEVIRLAAIPYVDAVLNQRQTPFQCVERVFSIEASADASASGWLQVAVELDIKGLGRWRHEVPVYILPRKRGPSLDDILDQQLP